MYYNDKFPKYPNIYVKHCNESHFLKFVSVFGRRELISCHWSLLIPSENIRKPSEYLRFSDVFMGYRMKIVTSRVNAPGSFHNIFEILQSGVATKAEQPSSL